MCRPIKFLLLIIAIQRYSFVECYAPGSQIWSRNLQKFIPVANVSAFRAYEQEIIAKSLEIEKHNFQGEVLKLGYVEDYNMVNFIDGDTKVTGVCGEIWNTLAEYSNFTLVTKKVAKISGGRRDNRGSTAISMIEQKRIQIIPRMAFTTEYLNVLDFTMPIWQTRYRLYIQPEWKSDANWIFNTFQSQVWIVISVFFLLLCVLGYFMQNISIKVSGDEGHRHTFHDHLFYTFATFCSQGFIPDTLDQRCKIFGLSKRIFAWLILIVLSTHVISQMTGVKLMQPPFQDFKSLLKRTDYNIATYTNTIAADEYRKLSRSSESRWRMRKKGRTQPFSVQKDMYKAACASRKLALFELEDTKQAIGDRYCNMVAVGKAYYPAWITFGLSKGFEYRRTVDIGILKMKEFGLIDRLKKLWLNTADQTATLKDLGQASFTPVNLDQVLMLFAILCIGAVAAVIIFILEHIVSIYESNQHRTVGGKTLVGKASLNEHRPPARDYLKIQMRRHVERLDVRRMRKNTVYVQNVLVVGSNAPAQDNDFPHRKLCN